MAKISTGAGPTLQIRVVPDEKAPKPDPLVLLTERDLKAESTPARIVWKKLPASKNFKMVKLEDLTPSGDVFQNIVVSTNEKRIECDFVPAASGPHEYRLVIKYKGTEYNTDDRGGPIGGRPVIRN